MKQYSSFTSGEASTFAGDRLERSVAGGLGCLPADPGVTGRAGAIGADLVPNGRRSSYHDQLPVDSVARPGRDILPLPPEATSTLYVEGLPPGSTRREVARILFDAVVLRSLMILVCLNSLPNTC